MRKSFGGQGVPPIFGSSAGARERLERLSEGDGVACWRLLAPDEGLDAVLAVHRPYGGRCFGGMRIRAYESPEAQRDEALTLSRAMGRKLALAR